MNSNSSELIVSDVDVDMLDDSPPGIGCRTLCSAATNPVKRGWRELDPHSVLKKRFDGVWPPKGDPAKDAYMVIACNSLQPEQEIVPSWASDPPGYASAVTAPLGDTAIRFGMQRICGETPRIQHSQHDSPTPTQWTPTSKAKTHRSIYLRQHSSRPEI